MNAPGKSTPATKALVKTPRPLAQLYTVDALAIMFRRRPRTIYDLLSRYAERFGPPMYEQLHFPRSHRLYRVVSAEDVGVLRALFPIYVKQKASRPMKPYGR